MKAIFIRFLQPLPLHHWWSDLMVAIPRCIGGLMLSIDFGASKFGMPWTPSEAGLSLLQVAPWFPEDVASFGAPFSWAPVFLAWMAAAAEAFGGLLWTLGLATRIASVFIALTMLVAIFWQKWGDGTWGMLPAMGFLWIAMYTLVLGSGRLGLDHWISQKI